ncbi:GOLPH3/VPS74 family protein [Dactylosporangium sp. CS-047395]|uniref:GOLPH3/VPS74 family protein n=1 Tax=Dactylosporangium sp. CS-047395 TaxID=3239936 RepID=UPI003D8FEEFC
MRNGLADDFLLLALDDKGNNLAGDPGLDYGLAGAVLLDLMLAGRLDLAEQRVTVTDPAPTGDPVTDGALTRIAGAGKPRKPDDWIQPLTDGLRAELLDRQVAAGVLRRDQDRVLWVFPRTRYASATGAEPAAETEVRRELAAALDGAGPVSARTAALLGLLQAVGLARKVFPDRPAKELKARLDEIAAGNWAAEAVRQAIARIQALIATMAAVTAATTAATTVTST